MADTSAKKRATIAAKRRRLKAAIKKVEQQIKQAEGVQKRLKRADDKIDVSLERWERRLFVFHAGEMAPGVVTDRFEGESAEKIKARLPEPLEEMDADKSSAQCVQREISIQIRKLDTYISKKKRELASLRAQLAAL